VKAGRFRADLMKLPWQRKECSFQSDLIFAPRNATIVSNML
jgi:hypothetical protein